MNMLIETAEELANFGKPDFVIYNAGEISADQSPPGDTGVSQLEARKTSHPENPLMQVNEERIAHSDNVGPPEDGTPVHASGNVGSVHRHPNCMPPSVPVPDREAFHH
jgi:hypothetical protein